MKAELNRSNLVKAVLELTTIKTVLQVELEFNIRHFKSVDNTKLIDRIVDINNTIQMFNTEIITNHELL